MLPLWKVADIKISKSVREFNDFEKIPRGPTTPLEDILKKVIYSDKATRRLFIFIFSIPWGLEYLKALV